jgi:hypothetical protein
MRGVMSRGRLVAIVVGLVIGAALGAAYRFRESLPGTGFPSPGFFIIVVTVAVLGLLLVAALVLSLSTGTKPLAGRLVGVAIAVVVGLPVGYLVGPTSIPPQDLTGTIEVRITNGGAVAPATYGGNVTCTTERDSAVLMEIRSGGIGEVEGHPLVVGIVWLDPVQPEVLINLTLMGGDDASGLLSNVDVAANRRSGSASFGSLAIDDLDPDPPGGWHAPAGTASWSCG